MNRPAEKKIERGVYSYSLTKSPKQTTRNKRDRRHKIET